MTNRMSWSMVCRRVALGSLLIVLSVLVFVASCTSPECADGADGCPCTTSDECELPNSCYATYCDGTCHVQAFSPGGRCWIFPCPHPDYCFGFCTAETQCVECLENAHCGPGHTCEPDHVCSRCDDGVKNGDETDVDCGGSCPLCPGTCNVDGDCPGGYCWEGSCARCDDAVMNGDETGVDCGVTGGHCPICFGAFCESNDECASKACEWGVCCATPCPLCTDCHPMTGECEPRSYGVPDGKNAPDPSIICAGNNICDGNGRCALMWGQPCTQNEECASNRCIDGVCDA
jgi:hypothetical protein